MSTLQSEDIVALCQNKPYITAFERYGLSFSTYIAVRRDGRYPPRNNYHRRNMDVRRRVIEEVRCHPHRSYREVASALSLPLIVVWKIFTDYMLHDDARRVRISKTNIELM